MAGGVKLRTLVNISVPSLEKCLLKSLPHF